MNNKFINWVVLIVSGLLIIGTCYVLITDLSFFITRKETTAKVISITKPYDYRIQLIYFNDNLKKNISTIVKLKGSYKNKIEGFDESVSIYYSGLFPRDVYIQNCKVPKKGIIAWELVMLVLMCIGLKSGFDGIRKK